MLAIVYGIVKVAGGVLFTAGVVAVALPSLISTGPCLRGLLHLLSQRTPGPVEISGLEGGWFTPVKLRGLQVFDRAGDGNVRLLHVQQVSTTASLLQMLSGDDFDIVVSQPTINCAYDTAHKDFKLSHWMVGAGLLAATTTTTTTTTTPAAAPSSAHPGQDAAAVCVADNVAGSAAAAAGVDAIARVTLPPGNSTNPPTAGASLGAAVVAQVAKLAEEARGRVTGRAATAGGTPGGTAGRTPAGREEAQPHQQVAAGPANGGVTAAGAAATAAGAVERPPSRVLAMLSKADATMGITADFRSAHAQVHVAGGVLQVPFELRCMVGQHIHVTGALGKKLLADMAEEMAVDMGWTDEQPLEGHKPSAHSQEEPFLLHIDSDHFHAESRGWRDIAAAGLRLHRPATAHMDFTPALAKFGLSIINPLLTDVVSMVGDKRVSLSFAPEGLQIPYKSATLTVAPMKLQLGCNTTSTSSVTQVLRLLQLHGGANMKVLGDAEMSACDITLVPGVKMQTHRVDMAMAVGGRRVQLAVWGDMDLAADRLDMQVGFPAATLALLGVRDVPPDYVLPVPLRGTTEVPALDVVGAGAKLAKLLLRQNIRSAQQPRGDGSTGQDGGGTAVGMAGGTPAGETVSASSNRTLSPAAPTDVKKRAGGGTDVIGELLRRAAGTAGGALGMAAGGNNNTPPASDGAVLLGRMMSQGGRLLSATMNRQQGGGNGGTDGGTGGTGHADATAGGGSGEEGSIVLSAGGGEDGAGPLTMEKTQGRQEVGGQPGGGGGAFSLGKLLGHGTRLLSAMAEGVSSSLPATTAVSAVDDMIASDMRDVPPPRL